MDNVDMEFQLLMGYNLDRKEVIKMRCEYKDGFKVDYSGSLHITKGDGVDVTIKGGQLDPNAKIFLDSAASQNSCQELRAASKVATLNIQQALETE